MKRLRLLMTAAFIGLLTLPVSFSYAQDEHGDSHAAEHAHEAEKAEKHADEHGHEAEETEKHAEEHEPKSEQTEGHVEEDGHDEEGMAVISPASLERMGVVLEQTGPAMVNRTVPIMGRITLNQNTKADVRARFSGIVRSVRAELGEHVEKGQVLAVVEANDSLRNYEIISPVSGSVLVRNTNVGDVTGDEPLFKIADLSNVWAKFHIFPKDAERVKSGLAVKIHTLEEDKQATGKIDMFLPTADELSQTQIAIVVLPNPERIWKPGMVIEGDVTVDQTRVPVAVKASALQKMEEDGDVVFVQDGEGFKARPVKIGQSGNGYVEITEGLKAGERYAAEGSFIIKSDILKSTATHAH